MMAIQCKKKLMKKNFLKKKTFTQNLLIFANQKKIGRKIILA